jgi:zinc transport system ATP-binding protein
MTAEPTHSVIDLRGVWFSYDGALVIENASLSVGRGDFACIVGPNGGGKTTLIKLVLGLLTPSRGVIRVFGMPPSEARPNIGYIPQNPQVDPQFPATVTDVALMGRLSGRFLAGRYRAADRAAAWRALEQVGLADRRDAPFAALSGGQRQRALIARALAAEPQLLLMDEPTANLDRLVEHDFYHLLKDLNERLTIVMVSHDLGFVSEFVKTVVCVKRNVVVHPTSEITGAMIDEIYGMDMRVVRHDVRCAEGDSECQNS